MLLTRLSTSLVRVEGPVSGDKQYNNTVWSTQARQAKNSSSKLSGEAALSRCSMAAAFLCAPKETCALLKSSSIVVGTAGAMRFKKARDPYYLPYEAAGCRGATYSRVRPVVQRTFQPCVFFEPSPLAAASPARLTRSPLRVAARGGAWHGVAWRVPSVLSYLCVQWDWSPAP